MAILKNLIVNGSSRFLNTTYFQDVSIAGSAVLASLSLSGNLSVTGTSTLSGNTTVGGTLGVTGATTFTGMITTNGGARFNGGIELYGGAAAYIDFHYNNSTADYTSRIIESSSGTLHITGNINIASTISAPTGNIADIKATNINTTNIRWVKAEEITVADIGGTFIVAPTIYFTSGGTSVYISAINGTTVTMSITDDAITTAELGGHTWKQYSKVKLSGAIGGCVLGSSDGYLSAQLNTTSHVANVVATIANASQLTVGTTYSGSNVQNLAMMMYAVGNGSQTNTLKVGMILTSYGDNYRSYLDIYSGGSNTSVTRLGNLGGLTFNGTTLANQWGLLTTNGYFSGTINATAGFFGGTNGTDGWQISTGKIQSTYTYSNATKYMGIGTYNHSWAFYSGASTNGGSDGIFRVGHGGELYATNAHITGEVTATSGTIGGVTANTSYGLYTNSKTSATSTNTGFLISKDGAIYLGAYNSTNGACPFQVTSAGALTAISGKIGGWSINANCLNTESTNPYVLLAPGIGTNKDVFYVRTGSGTTADPYKWPIVMRANGYFYADNATINGTLTAGANSRIGPWYVTTTSIYKGANTLGSTTSGAAYFGDLGLSVGNKFRVDASGVATLGDSSGYHATMDTDSFDVLNGSTMLATFGENVVLGSNSDVQLSINSSGIIMTDNYFKIQNYFGDADIFTVKVRVPDVRTYETKQSYFEYYSPDMVFNSELANIEIKGNFIQGVGQNVYLVLLDKTNDWSEYSRVQLSTSYYTSGYDASKAYVRINNDGIDFINNTMSQTVAQHPIIDWACIAFDVTLQDTPLTTMNIIGDLNLSGRYDENSETTIGGRIVCEEIANSDGTTLGAISHIGSIIMSTTLDTMDKVIAIYGGDYWIQHSGYFLRGATSGVTDDFDTSDGGADSVTLTAAQSGVPAHSHPLGGTAILNNANWSGETYSGTMSGSGYVVYQRTSSQTATNKTATNNNTAANASQAHTNLPKYKNVYIWERTL